jgi:photosystem II stability/assembly factor-like uncharacterized protein
MAQLMLNGCVACVFLMLGASPAPAEQPLIPDGAFPAVDWRLVGPLRGGWSTMAVGVPAEPDTYYFGAAGGGVWKTTDSGRTWHCMTDGQPITAIGALAVAPSDPRVLYAGTGQPEPRYDIIAGSGVYRSADAGKTWQPAGLTETRHIGALLIDARDANVVLVAALGHVFGPSPERGVYRTDDGGQHWSKTLFVDDDTGAVDLAVDPANPDIVYAATWTVRVYPWLSYFTPIEGPGSALYRSADGGRTWVRLAGEGWPQGALGRIGIAVTRAHGATRLYASVTHKERGGLYRSDDDGGHWQKVNDADWVTSWYMSRLTVSPLDPDVLYTVGQSVHESRDAGKTFSVVRGAPGGDDFHFLWINPLDPRRRIAASDQGAIVTLNGGASWSDWYNQPTGQFYYLATDDRFPYWIYSGQQDSGTVGIASRSNYGAIGLRDWNPVGGDERDYDLPDPDDPGIVYGSGLGGRISRWSAATGAVENVTPWPVNSYGKRPTDFRYHYTWFTPLAFSKRKPYALYAGAQVLFRSLDRGTHWEVISPDLSGRTAGPHDCGGDLNPSRALECGYGVINTIAPSPRDNAEIWVGTDDGRVWLTQDAGAHWRAVTPPGIPAWAKVSSIDLSDKTPGLAYVAVDNHRQDDFRPYIYVTRDGGVSWTSLAAGLPAEHFVSVVRQDPVRPGLLYAGTDVGVWVSFDAGAHWQSLQRNLPPVWVHDLLVKDRDLVAATNGRGIWVLDDLSPLRQVSFAVTGAARLYAPAPAYRLRPNQNKDTPFTPETPLGRNPPTGAVIDYWIARDTTAPVELEIRDPAGALVRRFSSADVDGGLAAKRYFSDDWLVPAPRLSTAAGAHRFVWNLRLPRPRAVEYTYSIAASLAEGTELLPAGPLALPGDYRLTLTVDGARFDAPLTVKPDPRVTVSRDDLAASLAFFQTLAVDLERAWRGFAEVSAVRKQLAARRASLGHDPKGAPLLARLAALDAALEPLTAAADEDPRSFAAASETLAGIATDVEAADRAPTGAQREAAGVTAGVLGETGRRWASVRESELPDINRQLAAHKLAPLAVPDAAHLEGVEPPESHDLP